MSSASGTTLASRSSSRARGISSKQREKSPRATQGAPSSRLGQAAQRILHPQAAPVAERPGQQLWVDNRVDDAQDRALDHPVLQDGHAEDPLAARRLRDLDSVDRRRLPGALTQFLRDRGQPLRRLVLKRNQTADDVRQKRRQRVGDVRGVLHRLPLHPRQRGALPWPR